MLSWLDANLALSIEFLKPESTIWLVVAGTTSCYGLPACESLTCLFLTFNLAFILRADLLTLIFYSRARLLFLTIFVCGSSCLTIGT